MRAKHTTTIHKMCAAGLLVALTVNGAPHVALVWLALVAFVTYPMAARHVSEHLEARRYARRKALRAWYVRHALR